MEDHSSTRDAPQQASGRTRDLLPRIVSGLILAGIALALDYAGLIPFAALVLTVSLLMSWEWGRVVRGLNGGAATFAHAATAAIACVLATAGYPALALVAIAAGAIIAATIELDQRPVMSALGVLYTGVPAVSLLWLRSDEPHGFLAVLFIFIVVWTSDTAAFAAGRTFGGPKLWPRVSPNKTWSGLIGGVAASALSGAIFSLLFSTGMMPQLTFAGLVLGLVAQAGDLAESALKRGFGVKDASALIPGHGGFMDRADSIVAVAVAAALLGVLVDVHAPARALLFGM